MDYENAVDIIKCLAWHERPPEDAVEKAVRVVSQEDWVLVSERLPDPLTYVNITCKAPGRENWVAETFYCPITEGANIRGYSDWGNIPILNNKEAEVIAWQERFIPEPYREVDG